MAYVITTSFDDVKVNEWERYIIIIYTYKLTHFFDTETSVYKLETCLANAYGTCKIELNKN